MGRRVELRVRPAVDDAKLSELHRQAFGSSTTFLQSWAARLERHSLSWVGAFEDEALVGFVHLCWDGGAHAFLLDTVVRPTHQRRGIGRALVRSASDAATAGCQWLHVDYEPHLHAFYRDACGFAPTAAGLVRLTPPGNALPDIGTVALRTRPMTEAEFDVYRERIVHGYAEQHGRAGNWSRDEARSRSRWLRSINVFGSNEVARRLYTSAGYDVVSQQMRKPLRSRR